MSNIIIPLTMTIAEIAYKKGIYHVVISPGSRSAPLIVAFARHPKINTYIIPDERSAGYIALGMAIILKQPVGLVCTSGTASINLFSAVSEAYYQNIPIVIFTADRPPEWIDQHAGQTIHQNNLYGNHIKGFYTFPSDQNFKDVNWYAERIINEAINLVLEGAQGPVHINIPIREPFYPSKEENYDFNRSPKIIEAYQPKHSIDENSWNSLNKTWGKVKNVLIVAGQGRYDMDFIGSLGRFAKNFNIPVIGDSISNIHGLKENLITHQDLILGKLDQAIESLTPDLLITFGNGVISKNLKKFLRKYMPYHHWHIQKAGYVPDTFQSLTSKIPLDPKAFFDICYNNFKKQRKTSNYLNDWNDIQEKAALKINSFFPKLPFSELEAVWQILQALPDNINLHLANSMPVRLVNLIGLLKPQIEVFSNRGVSGIDGCTSTVVGISIHSSKLNILITGDMAFFYDRNGLWHNNIPGNLRIIILNNHGGGIFRLIDGPSNLPEMEEFFETNQKLTARNTASDFGVEYHYCNDSESLRKNFIKVMADDGKAKILELETNSQINKSIFDTYISQFK